METVCPMGARWQRCNRTEFRVKTMMIINAAIVAGMLLPSASALDSNPHLLVEW
jgi:hypothetical protein